MNPWYKRLIDDCLAEHDRVCIDGAECPERETHTMEAYVTVALCERVEALQGQMDRVRELHQPCNHDAPCRGDCAECGQHMPCDTIRALDGDQ